jgi:hypothetical protein
MNEKNCSLKEINSHSCSSSQENVFMHVKAVPETAICSTDSVSSSINIPTQLFIEIISGPYQGATFLLKPEHHKSCFIWRSSGKEFRSNGISLPQNPEVSTTHAEVEIKIDGNGLIKYFFTDTRSSWDLVQR